jgi:hypothetical protein
MEVSSSTPSTAALVACDLPDEVPPGVGCELAEVLDPAVVHPAGEKEVSAQDFNAIMQGRLCFDVFMPFLYFCTWPRPSFQPHFPGLS